MQRLGLANAISSSCSCESESKSKSRRRSERNETKERKLQRLQSDLASVYVQCKHFNSASCLSKVVVVVVVVSSRRRQLKHHKACLFVGRLEFIVYALDLRPFSLGAPLELDLELQLELGGQLIGPNIWAADEHCSMQAQNEENPQLPAGRQRRFSCCYHSLPRTLCVGAQLNRGQFCDWPF